MKNLKSMIPTILFILFELAFGILLISSPEQLTKTVLICFGIVLLIIGFIYFIRFFKERKKAEDAKVNYLTMPFAIISVAVALFCVLYALLSDKPQNFAVIIYGVIFIVIGAYKLKGYDDDKKEGTSTSVLTLISGVLSVLLGIAVIVLYMMKSMESDHLLLLAGIAIIVEAALDVAAIATAKPKNPALPAVSVDVPSPTDQN